MSEADSAPLVSFVVPLYNTGASLPRLLSAFGSLSVQGGYEVILVNDGSTDDTRQRVITLLPQLPFHVTLVDLARNYGEHAAVLEGFRKTRGTFVINLDDDLQNPLSEALKLLEHLRHQSCDVVYACYDQKKHPWFRNIGSRLTNACATLLLGKPPDLYLCSFRGMRRELVQRITQYRGPYPYVDGLILGATNRIDRLLVQHDERGHGQSGYTLRKLVRLWMNMFFNFSIMPLRAASVLGAVLCGFGLIMFLAVLFELLVQGRPAPGWGSLMAAIAVFSGAQLIMLGLIGEYLGRAYMTVSGKPQSLIRDIHFHHPPGHEAPHPNPQHPRPRRESLRNPADRRPEPGQPNRGGVRTGTAVHPAALLHHV